MGLFSKKEKVPDIPSAPALPDLPKTEEDKQNLPELPSFPATKSHENFNQQIVKSAVSDTPEVNEVPVNVPNELHVKEEPMEESMIPPKPSEPTPHIPELPRKKTLELTPSVMNSKQVTKQIEPIFIRIDKFQAAQKDFEEIREKVKEIESVLRKVKDLKVKENEEISGWSEEVEKIKSRLSEIDVNIFSEV
jgi:hypothetical protein